MHLGGLAVVKFFKFVDKIFERSAENEGGKCKNPNMKGTCID